jgi:peroxiredoxin
MHLVVAIAQLLLAAVFAVSGIAKLADRAGSRRSLVEFGLPEPIARPASVLLPLGELAVAGALVLALTAWWGALGALALLAVFTVAVAVNLARGRRPDCHCFGRLTSTPIGWQTVARNLLLMAAAGLVVSRGPHGVLGIGTLVATLPPVARGATITAVGAAIPLALVGWIVFLLWRQQGRLLLRIEALERNRPVAASPAAGLPMGAPAPEFRVKTLAGEERTLAALRAGDRPLLLTFGDPKCGPCTALLPRIARWQQDLGDRLRIVVVSRGSHGANEQKALRHGLSDVVLQDDFEVAELYRVAGTPGAVLVTADGKIGSPVAAGEPAIADLVAYAAAGPGNPVPWPPGQNGRAAPAAGPRAPRSRVGDRVPPVTLTSMDGTRVSLSDSLAGDADTLLIFWNPYCGFCQRMLGDLRAWEASRPADAPRITLISVGSVDANRALGLQAPVLLDEEFAVALQFGAPGTPSAVLVDAHGRIASPIAQGAAAVLELARPREPVAS